MHHYRISPAFGLLAVLMALIFGFVAIRVPAVDAATTFTNFEDYTPGTVNGQNGWVSTGAAGLDGAVFDHQISANDSNAPASFGARSLRISNAVTSSSYTNQTFSHSLADDAGETGAYNGGNSGGTRQPYYEVQFDFASAAPTSQQPGLGMSLSPDNGGAVRMSWISLTDTATGLNVEFGDFQSASANFIYTTIAAGLDRTQPHTIRITMAFMDGPATWEEPENDIVCVFIDGTLRHQGTSWENYHRAVNAPQITHTVDSMYFRTGGTAAPATAGKGFLFDNFRQFSGPIPAGFESGCTPAATPEPTAEPTLEPTAESTTELTPQPTAEATSELTPQPTTQATAQPPLQATPQPLPLCALFGGGTNPIVRADADYNQFCRIIVQHGDFVQPAAEVGDLALITAGIRQAVDIFEFNANGERVTIFDRPLNVCLQGTGQFYFRDATGQPRTTALLPSTVNGEYTCATIAHAGTVVLAGQ